MITKEDIELLKKYFYQQGKRINQVIQSVISWANITDKPSTFPPSAHTHNVGDVNGAVPDTRTLTANAPLTGGGDLSANRSFGLDYISTNLKLTSSKLNTIQDIDTTSSPTFSNLTINNVLQGNQTSLLESRLTNFTILPTNFAFPDTVNVKLETDILRFAHFNTNYTITSSGFTTGEINSFFGGNKAGYVDIIGKAEGSYVEVTNTTPFAYNAVSPYIYFYYKGNNVNVKIETRGYTTGTWTERFNGLVNDFKIKHITNPSEHVNGVRWTFTSIPLSGNVFVAWLGLLTLLGRDYNLLVQRQGDTMYGNLTLANNAALDVYGNARVRNYLSLDNQATSTTHAVRADRTLTTSYPLTGGGNLTANRTLELGYNTTNLKLTSNLLNTIQDIATTSSPTFVKPNFTSGFNIRYSSGNYGYAKIVTPAFTLNNNQVYLQWDTPPTIVGAVLKVTLFHQSTSVSNQGLITKQFYLDWRNDGIIYKQDSEVIHAIGEMISSQGYIGEFEVYDTDKLRLLIAKPSVGNRYYQVMIEIYSHRADYWQNYTISDPTSLTVSASTVYRSYKNRLGIGTTQPTEVLDVNGNIKAQTAKLTNLTDGYLPYHISDAAGLGNTNIYSNATKTGIGTTTLTELLNIEGNTKYSGNYSLYNSFTSGWAGSGWRLDYGITNPSTGTLELDDLWVRGTMHVYELIINQIRATNGSLFVSSSGKVAVVNSATSITLEDPDGHNIAPFLADDIILIQRVKLDSLTIVKRIVRRVNGISNMTLDIRTMLDAPADTGAIEVGDVIVRIGNTTNSARRGTLYLTSDDSNAPYQDIADGVDSWTAWTSPNKLKVRLGKLSGITDDFFGALSGYGLYAKDNIWLKGKIYAQAGGWIAGWNINSDNLQSPTVTTSGEDNNVTLEATSGFGLGLYVNMDTTRVNVIEWLSVGRIKTKFGYQDNFGIAFLNNDGDRYFEITNTTKQIAGWDFDKNRFYKSTDIELDATNKKISVNSDAVKMYYTSGADYGIKDSSNRFQLGSTNQIAGWSFDTGKLYRGTDIVLDAANKKIGVNNNAITMYYTSGADYGIKDSGNKFQLGSTNQISGWKFDTNILRNEVDNVYTTGRFIFTISPTGQNLGYGYNVEGVMQARKGYAIDWFKTATSLGHINIGQLYSDATANDTEITNSYGLQMMVYNFSTNQSDLIFRLGQNVYTGELMNQIAGWNFNKEKFWKDDVSLEATSSLKGLRVKDGADDIVKVGDFTNASPSYFTTNLTTLPDVGSDWVDEWIVYSNQFGWITMGYQFGSFDDIEPYYKSQFKIYLPLNANATKGKTIEIKFGIAEQETSVGDEKITPIWAWIETDKGKTNLQDITPAGGVYPIASTPVYENRTIVANIPADATWVRMYFAWYKNISSAWVPASVLLDNWSFKYYNKTLTELNKNGLVITKSPIAKVALTTDKIEFNVSELKASNRIEIGDWSLETEGYLEGDGVTINNRLVLKYKNTPKGAFKSSDGTYYTL